ncbi:RNA polymerase sigma factor [Alkalihalobacillus sp. AL-G]|uniref:RNA polymerase sigma factor n=1 Tax=Alkalihalobacillus sp. AL-G TaxID=2926399 RepID=UPI00272C0954|nr:RNA polymerase sigma factor [Alkalihalobacillus sp. AL-G]WLD92827.1 RNA polymerase sigma factor [Alkalihalobacillus sp. AL-G]
MNLEEKYQLTLEEYGDQIKGYCYKLAGVPWDGDDLYQETLLKAYKTAGQWTEVENPKAYLFKIATNTWIDICRKKKVHIETYEDNFLIDPAPIDFTIMEALEELVHKLPTRQASVILLIDAFAFSIKDTASMLKMTAGAVKSALHRARTTLKSAYQNKEKSKGDNADLISRFLSAFKRGEPHEIVTIYHELADRGVTVNRTPGINGYYFEFKDPDGNILSVFQKK